MRIILTPDMSQELLNNEDLIKNQEGPYRPQFDPVSKSFVSSIKCWPLEDFKGKFPQERSVIPGMESEVDDICIMKVNDCKVEYKVNRFKWCPTRNPLHKKEEINILDYSIYVYDPKFNNDAFFITKEGVTELADELRKYHIDVKLPEAVDSKIITDAVDEAFKKYTGICTYILFCGEYVIGCGKWTNKVVW